MHAIVILAAGKGTRMRSDLPKVLHPLLGKPLLEFPLRLSEALRIEHRVAVIGHRRAEVEQAFEGRGITWAVQEEQLGTGHAARIGIEKLAGELGGASGSVGTDVVVLNGDLPLLRPDTVGELLRRHAEAGAEATLLSCVRSDPTGFGRIVREPPGRSGSFRSIIEEPDADEEIRRIREVNVGAYVFRASRFLECYERTGRENRQGEYYLPDVVCEIARAGGLVETVKVEDETETLQVNSRADMAQVSEVIRRRLLRDYMESGVTIDDPATTYIEVDVAIGRDARIHPFTVIRSGVNIAPGCEVGPFAQLRPGSELDQGVQIGNFVEIKNSTIGEGTKINHLAYVGDAGVGRRVNIGAGTIVANYDGRKKHRTVVGDEAFIGSGTVLVAPVTVGARAVTGAGSVVLKKRDVAPGEVVAGVPAKRLKKKDETDTT